MKPNPRPSARTPFPPPPPKRITMKHIQNVQRLLVRLPSSSCPAIFLQAGTSMPPVPRDYMADDKTASVPINDPKIFDLDYCYFDTYQDAYSELQYC